MIRAAIRISHSKQWSRASIYTLHLRCAHKLIPKPTPACFERLLREFLCSKTPRGGPNRFLIRCRQGEYLVHTCCKAGDIGRMPA